VRKLRSRAAILAAQKPTAIDLEALRTSETEGGRGDAEGAITANLTLVAKLLPPRETIRGRKILRVSLSGCNIRRVRVVGPNWNFRPHRVRRADILGRLANVLSKHRD
jgi:hypothetical protein